MVLSADDQLDIASLLKRYVVALDRFGERDIATILSVFTEDATFSGPSGVFVGHDGIREWASRNHATNQIRHIVSNLDVEGSDDRAELRAYFVVVGTETAVGDATVATSYLHQVGTYRCDAKRTAAGWRLSSRHVQLDGTAT